MNPNSNREKYRQTGQRMDVDIFGTAPGPRRCLGNVTSWINMAASVVFGMRMMRSFLRCTSYRSGYLTLSHAHRCVCVLGLSLICITGFVCLNGVESRASFLVGCLAVTKARAINSEHRSCDETMHFRCWVPF